MAKMPWMQFYPSDWRTDPALSQCSPATRGIWLDCICAMHTNDRTGELVGTYESLARVARCLPSEMESAANELRETKTADVTICNGVVTLVNRRMKQAYIERKNTAERVKKHRKKQECHGTEVRSQKSEAKKEKNKIERFDEFWEAYQNKKDRNRCEQLWAKLSDADRAACIAAVPNYVANTPDKQYRKHPSTYLRGRNWEDENPIDKRTNDYNRIRAFYQHKIDKGDWEWIDVNTCHARALDDETGVEWCPAMDTVNGEDGITPTAMVPLIGGTRRNV